MAGVGWKTFVCVWVVTVQFSFSASSSSSGSVQSPCTCLNARGSPVDWFFVYKAPSVNREEAVMAPFLYMDSDSIKFRMSPLLVNDEATPFARTLKNSVYRKHASEPNLAYLMYNDEVPPHAAANDTSRLLEQERSSRGSFTTKSAELLRLHGHTKGVLASDSKTGFWLTHSVPKFPPRAFVAYQYPGTAMRYAQHILCVSLSVQSVNVVAEQLQFNYPQIYDSYIPGELRTELPNFETLAKKKPGDGVDHFSVATLSTLDGELLMNFAKNGVYNASLYRDLLAPHLHSSLRVETWQNGKGGKLGPECGAKLEYQVENIAAIDFGQHTYDGRRVHFPSTKDHSKWAVAARDNRFHSRGDDFADRRALLPQQRKIDQESANFPRQGEEKRHELRAHSHRVGRQEGRDRVPWKPWACIGDVNRMASQFARGGGTTCFSNAQVWQQLSSLIAQVDSCERS